MTLSRLHSVAFLGLEAVLVDVEVDVSKGGDKSILVIVGLPDAAVRESKDRVLAALKNSRFQIGPLYCTVNLAPGDLKKEGALYDLPIALGLLQSLGIIKHKQLYQDYLIVGELGLSGSLRPIFGALAVAMLAKILGKKGVILCAQNAREAAAVPGIQVIAVHDLNEAVQFINNPSNVPLISSPVTSDLFKNAVPSIDFSDIKGHSSVKRGMEIAASGGHNIILSGPPGSGKTMLAKALIGIMPELSVTEALETTKIHSIAGIMAEGQNVVLQRPFRSPHHTISYAGLIGGGANPRPGEVSLAHNGILFLDELPEFSRTVLEVLRQPLEDRKVTISRANGNFTFPTNFICVGAMNPCPCGMLGHPEKPCKDTQIQIDRYRNKISGPLWDRMDLHVDVPALRYQEMLEGSAGETSTIIRQRVVRARMRQAARLGKDRTNSQLTSGEIKKHIQLNTACHQLLQHAVDVMGISARACDRLIRVSRTIADLADSESLTEEHLLEAISYRNL